MITHSRRFITCSVIGLLLVLALSACSAPAAQAIKVTPVVLAAEATLALVHEAMLTPLTNTPQALMPVAMLTPLTNTPQPPLTESTVMPTPDPGANDPAYYYGGLVITIENVGETLAMKRKGSFLLALGERYTWKVENDPPDVITLNPNIVTEPGEQGLFVARRAGKATLRAIGDPACRTESPPCSHPTLLFTISIVVED